ncbi:MAG: hypothetical protein ACTHMU_07635 [Thermomicrobiales bacterium]
MVRRLFEDEQRKNERGKAAVVGESAAAGAVVIGRPAAPDDAMASNDVAAPVLAPLALPERRVTIRPWTRVWPALWQARGDLAAALFLCLVAVICTWPIARHPASTLPDLGDPLDSIWRMSWPLHAILHDPRHFLDANTYYPFTTTYLFDELVLGVAIVVAPVQLLGGSGVLAYNVALLLAFALNGVAMYLLGKHLTGSRVAAIAGALVFAATPFRLQHLGHIGLSTAYWLPLALLCLDRLLLRPRWREALLFAFCVAMQALSAQYYGFQAALVIGLYLLWAAVWRRDQFWQGQFFLRLIAAVVLAELLLLPVVAPYALVKGTWGYSRGLDENELYSATLSSFLATSPGNWLGGWLASALRGVVGARSWTAWLYPGLGAVALALAGFWRRQTRVPASDAAAPPARRPHDLYSFFGLLALFGAAMSLGPALYAQHIDRAHAITRLMPYRLVFNLVPGFDAMRAPERFGNVWLLGLGGAVVFGAAAVLAALNDQRWRWPRLAVAARVALAALLIAVVGAEYLHAPVHPAQVPAAPPVYGWLAAQAPGPAIELPMDIPANELNREQLRQYWSMPGWHPRVNGSSDIAPRAYAALRQDMARFPDDRTLITLQGLGVRYVIVHRAQYPASTWPAIAARLAAYHVTLVPRGTFGDDLAYELQPDPRFAALRRALPNGAAVLLSSNDPIKSDTYMAMLGWQLHDHPLVTWIVPTFGLRYARPNPDHLPPYVICFQGESPTFYGYPTNLPVVYEDNLVRVYRNTKPPSSPAR